MKSKAMFKHVPLCFKTRKFLYLSSLIFALFLLPAISFAAPKLFFSDLDSGPKTGWEGSTTKGAAVTIWGKGFNSTRGSSYVTVNGAQLTNASDYAEWGVTGTANGIPRGLERTTFWIPSSAADGAGQITITVSGETSNALSFTVSLAKIYFISVSDGNNTYNGLYSTFQGGSNGPFRDIKMFNPGLNPSGDTESYIVYVKGGTYTALDVDSAFVALRGPYGAADRRHALIGYPGETPTIDTTNATRGIIWEADYSPYGPIDYMTISKLRGINGLSAIGLDGQYNRVVGNTFKDYLSNVWSGVVWVGSAKYASIYGNMFDHNGYDSYKHNIYIKTQVSFGSGDPSTHDIYVGWNEFSNPVASDTHGGVIFVSKSSESAVASYPTRDIHIHNNYFHDGNEDFIYIGDGVDIGDVYIYNNIFSGGTSTNGTMSFNHGTNNVYLYNNVFYQTGAGTLTTSNPGMLWGTGTTKAYFKNNVWYTNPGIPFIYWENYQGATFNSDHDLYFNPGGTTTLPSGSGITVTNAGIGDPLFVNPTAGDFHLQSGSPAIDAGVNIGSPVLYDFDGNTRPMGTGYDIGAYEYAGPAVPMLQFSSATYSVSEGAGTATISVTRIGSASGAVSVNYATSNGTATSGSDYTAASGTLNWADTDVATKSFTVSITDDTAIENDETINLTLSNPTGNGAILGSQSTAVLTILDNDGPSTLRFENSSYSVSEGAGTATIRVLRTGSSVGAVSVNYATSNGTATAGSDYTAASGTLNWASGDTAAKSFTITIINDTVVESNETVNITLSNQTTGALLGGTNPVVLTITDNDSAGGGGGSSGGNNLNAAGGDSATGGGCGFVKDNNSKGPRANGGAATFAMMLIIALAGIAIARRFSNRFSYNL